jgi:hypothetical protein
MVEPCTQALLPCRPCCAAPDFFEAARMAADEATLIAIRVAVPGA